MHFLPFAAVFACVAVAASVRLPFSEPETSLQDAFNSEMIGPLNSQNISENVLKTRLNPIVTYDKRSFIINGNRELLIVGSIHYPRSTPDMWPGLFKQAKAAGINTIDTYVFWNLHETKEGVYDFETDSLNLPYFLSLAKEHGLFVVLRVGPYVCAEVNFGGFPAWLLSKPDMVLRTFNKPYMVEMEKFVRKVVDVARPYLIGNNGSIIMAQIENEYGDVQWKNGIDGQKYINWAIGMAKSLDFNVPWFLCKQGNVLKEINTCNGFYCDNWIQRHSLMFPNQPAMFTELWAGWYQLFGESRPTRSGTDVALSVARFIARGGSYVAYYMWHGGTNFGRNGGGPYMTTSYDYDAPVNEYGLPNEPKFSHLQALHQVLNQNKEFILENKPENDKTGVSGGATVYGDKNGDALIFLANTDSTVGTANYLKKDFRLSPWSVLIVRRYKDGRFETLFDTSKVPEHVRKYETLESNLNRHPLASAVVQGYRNEPFGTHRVSLQAVKTAKPQEQVRFTMDTTDYVWYIRSGIYLMPNAKQVVLEFEQIDNVVQIFWGDKLVFAGKGGSKMKFTVPMNNSRDTLGQHTLMVLSSTFGINHYGDGLERRYKGIIGAVHVNGEDVTSGDWTMIPGMEGWEDEKLFENASSKMWNASITSTIGQPLKWYRMAISNKRSISTMNSPELGFALDLGTLGKGYAWVNGHNIGRYWNLAGTEKPCNSCSTVKPYIDVNCRKDCGLPSQRFYHVPKAWLNSDGVNEVVVFEEFGGDPRGVLLVRVALK